MSIKLHKGRLTPYERNPSSSALPISVGDAPIELLQNGVNRFTLTIESVNGTVLTRDLPRTTLAARIYTSSGEDITVQLKKAGLPLRWEATEYKIGAGFETRILGAGFSLEYELTSLIHRTEITLSFAEREAVRLLFPQSEVPGAVRYAAQLNDALISIKEEKRITAKSTLQLDVWKEMEGTKKALSGVEFTFQRDLQTTVNNVFTERKGELKGDKGDNGERGADGASLRPNEYKKNGAFRFFENDTFGCRLEELGGGKIKIQITQKGTANGRTCASFYTNPTFPGGERKTTICSFRVSESSQPMTTAPWRPDHKKRADGLYYFIGRNYGRFAGFELYWNNSTDAAIGDYAILEDFKVEIVPDGEPILPTAYVPHKDEMRGVQLSELVSNTEFMQHTARKVSEVGQFVTREVVNSTIAAQIAPLHNERRMVSRQGSLPYTVVLDNPENYAIGKIIEYDFTPSLQCIPGDGRVYAPYEVFASDMMALAKNNNTIAPPIPTACYNNHYEFKVVPFEGRKVWLWANYEAIKFAETEEQVRTQATQIADAIADTQRLSGESINIRSRILELNEMNVSQGLSIASMQGEITAINQRKTPIYSNKTATVVATRGTFNMTHNNTPTTFRLPTPSEGQVCYVWANHWVSTTKTLYKPLSPANAVMINTATSSEVSSIPLARGHIYHCIAINATTWLVTDLSR